jgi:hypothetical protein
VAGGSGHGRSSATYRAKLLTRSASQKEAVITAAWTLFSTRRYADIDCGDIAALAQVEPHVPALHFGGKLPLYLRLVREAQRDALAAFAARSPSPGDLEGVAAQLFEVLNSEPVRRLQAMKGWSTRRALAAHHEWGSLVTEAFASKLAEVDPDWAARHSPEAARSMARALANAFERLSAAAHEQGRPPTDREVRDGARAALDRLLTQLDRKARRMKA